MKLTDESGFTLVEFIVVFCMISILFLTLVSCQSYGRDKSREGEVKANIHTIRVALERYAVDHSGEYPKMIWGGDSESWSRIEGTGCRTMWQHEAFNGENEDVAAPPIDPLIKFGYMESYPRNPFANANDMPPLETIIKWTGLESGKLGDGDPRFGFKGRVMGNILEDPRYLWKAPALITRIKNCLPEDSETNHACMINVEGKINPFYSRGGLPDKLESHWTSDDSIKLKSRKLDYAPRGKTISAYWPGQFFYRSAGSFLFPQNFLVTSLPDPELISIWQFPYTKIDRYFLGGYGAWTTDGMDIIRLTDIEGKTVNNWGGCTGGGFYNPHPGYPRTSTAPVLFSSPEIMGGGNFETMPYFPYLDPESGDWMYGAPDGYADGVIIALTSGVDRN